MNHLYTQHHLDDKTRASLRLIVLGVATSVAVSLAFISGCSVRNNEENNTPPSLTNQNTATHTQLNTTPMVNATITKNAHAQSSTVVEYLTTITFTKEIEFRLFQDIEHPRTVHEWYTMLKASNPSMVFVVNGTFFDDKGNATGFLKIDQQTYGVANRRTYNGTVRFGKAPSGAIEIRNTASNPYVSSETTSFVLQSFPLLIADGKRVYTNSTGNTARRTVVFTRTDGTSGFLFGSYGTWTLADMANYLTEKGDIAWALNLDGGSSTGVFVPQEYVDGGEEIFIPSARVPHVIAGLLVE